MSHVSHVMSNQPTKTVKPALKFLIITLDKNDEIEIIECDNLEEAKLKTIEEARWENTKLSQVFENSGDFRIVHSEIGTF